MSRYVKQDGALHEITGRYAKVDGVWHTVTARYVKQNGAWNQVYSSGKKLSDLPVGSLLKINESGVPQQYIIVHQGNPNTSIYDSSCNGTWILRKNVVSSMAWEFGNYSSSPIHSYLNGSFLATFDSDTQSNILQIKIPYAESYDSSTINALANGLSTKIFIPAVKELGIVQYPLSTEQSTIPDEGAVLSYFDYPNGSDLYLSRSTNSEWWTRSLFLSTARYVIYVHSTGEITASENCTNSSGVRPAMIINSDTLVSSSVDSDNCYTLQ